LRRAVHDLLGAIPDLARLVLEGGGPIADIWVLEAQRRGLSVTQISAEDWRGRLLRPRDQQRRNQSKSMADHLARRVIAWCGAPRPTSLRHDAAEAILIGLWGVLEAGWLDRVPESL
jgi:hypothetical protein